MWRFGGFFSVCIDKPSDMSCGWAMTLFRNPRTFIMQKMFVVDVWIPFFTVRFELHKDWPGRPIKGGEWYWEPGYGPGKMIEARPAGDK